MKKTLFLYVSALILTFVSCRENINISDVGSYMGNLKNIKLYKTTSPKLGLWDVWYRQPYNDPARIDSFKTLLSNGIKFIALGGFYANESRRNGSWYWTDLDNAFNVSKNDIGFERIVFPFSHEQVENSGGWTISLLDEYINHCKALSGSETYFYLDEPYWRNYDNGSPLTNLQHILNYTLNHVYVAEPFVSGYSIPQSDINKFYSVTYDNYPEALNNKNNWYKYFSVEINKKLTPLLGIDRNYNDTYGTGYFEDELRDELYAASAYTNEIWFYSYEGGGPAFRLYNPIANWNNFIQFLQNFSVEHYGEWDLKSLEGYGGTEAIPCPEDYDGDGYADISVKTNNGEWLIDYASNGFGGWDVSLTGYGTSSAHPSPEDYDGDGKADISVKTDNGEWLIDYASNGFGSWDVSLTGYGTSSAHPYPADYDGDGKADISVKTDNGEWLIDYASNGFGSWDVSLTGYGTSSAHPSPEDYDGDGKTDISVKTDNGEWLIDYASNGFGNWDVSLTGYGTSSAYPSPADYDGDGYADLAVKTSNGKLLIDYYKINFDWYH